MTICYLPFEPAQKQLLSSRTSGGRYELSLEVPILTLTQVWHRRFMSCFQHRIYLSCPALGILFRWMNPRRLRVSFSRLQPRRVLDLCFDNEAPSRTMGSLNRSCTRRLDSKCSSLGQLASARCPFKNPWRRRLA